MVGGHELSDQFIGTLDRLSDLARPCSGSEGIQESWLRPNRAGGRDLRTWEGG
jgi:hypothetical protein